MARRNTLSKRLADLDSKPKSSGPPMPGQRQEDDKPIDGVVFVMMNLIVLFGIIVAAVFFGTNSIESSIENEIADTLLANGVTEVEVIATARDVLVVGEVPSEDLIDEIIDYIGTVPGVVTFETNLRVRVVQEPTEVIITADPINLEWTAAGATVSGNVSSQDYLDAFLLSLGDTFGNVESSGAGIVSAG